MKKPFKKSTMAVVDERVKQIVTFYKEGRTRSFIQQFSAENGWDLSERRIDDLIARANKIILEQNTATMNESLALISENYWSLYRKALIPTELKEMGDLSEARLILSAIAKLKGLDKLTVNHVIDDRRETENISDDDLEFQLADETAVN